MSRNVWVSRDVQIIVQGLADHALLRVAVYGVAPKPVECMCNIRARDKEETAKHAVRFVRKVLGMPDAE